MRFVVFDTETTGFNPGSICQLSYILHDDRIGLLGGRNYYFTVDYVEPGAQKIHGLSVTKLNQLSGGQTFHAHASDIAADFNSCQLLVAHNVSFDSRFIKAEFKRARVTLRTSESFCTMKELADVCQLSYSGFGNKWPKLGELARRLSISDGEIKALASKAFGIKGAFSAHDARFDSAATYLCYLSAVERGLI
ncbi:MAG: 3'-5' exonuclease [Deltaproteobacteria bacterium]|jgi:DNA polymerase-3 subunit epsilon|nr:3'-5' exonuclease [Deltaproteobacteria bacterium]